MNSTQFGDVDELKESCHEFICIYLYIMAISLGARKELLGFMLPRCVGGS